MAVSIWVRVCTLVFLQVALIRVRGKVTVSSSSTLELVGLAGWLPQKLCSQRCRLAGMMCRLPGACLQGSSQGNHFTRQRSSKDNAGLERGILYSPCNITADETTTATADDTAVTTVDDTTAATVEGAFFNCREPPCVVEWVV